MAAAMDSTNPGGPTAGTGWSSSKPIGSVKNNGQGVWFDPHSADPNHSTRIHRTVKVVNLTPGGKDYNRGSFAPQVSKTCGLNKLEACGPMAVGHVWMLTFVDVDSKDRFVAAVDFTTREGVLAQVNAVKRQRYPIRYPFVAVYFSFYLLPSFFQYHIMDYKSTINFLTLNVNGLVVADRRRLIFDSIITLQKDVVFLQETHLVNDQQIKEVSDLWKGPSIWAMGTWHSKGVGILFSPRVHVKIHPFALLNVYCPNDHNERARFLTDLVPLVNDSVDFVVGGDFNFVEYPSLDKKGGRERTGASSRKPLSDIKERGKLSDVFRSAFPGIKSFTYFSHNTGSQSRIDRFYLADSLINHIKQVRHIVIPRCDHKGCTFSLNVIDSIRGKGFWKSA
jgi:exonuclease III